MTERRRQSLETPLLPCEGLGLNGSTTDAVYGEDLVGAIAEGNFAGGAAAHKEAGWGALLMLLLTLIVFGTANFVTFKAMYTVYGQNGAYFVSQGVNLLYLLYGGAALIAQRWIERKAGKAAKTDTTPQKHFVTMGLLDCCGTFLAAMGAPTTPGQLQILFNQSLIPVTMLSSFLFLRSRYSLLEVSASVLIMLGSVLVIFPTNPSSAALRQTALLPCLLYWTANFPMALSTVYKERAFNRRKVNVLYFSQWLSFYQFLWGFAMAPLLIVPGGSSTRDIIANFVEGARCFIGWSSGCQYQGFALLCGYCGLNFVLSLVSLTIVKKCSAAFSSFSSALLMPITTLAFSLPFLGRHRESVRFSTVTSLFVVVLGIVMYQWARRRKSSAPAASVAPSIASDISHSLEQQASEGELGPQLAIKERVVGIWVDELVHRAASPAESVDGLQSVCAFSGHPPNMQKRCASA